MVVFKDKADDLGVGIGDPIHIVFSNGVERDVTVAGIFADNSLGSPLWISTGLLRSGVRSATGRSTRARPRQGRRRSGHGQAGGGGGDRRLPAGGGPDQRRVPRRPGGPDQSVAGRDLDAARVRDRDLVLRHRDHARPVGVRAHARDRPAAGGRHEPSSAAPCGAMGGGDRVGVRGRRRCRGRAR